MIPDKKNRLLTWALIVLIVVNLSALGSFFFFTRPAPPEADSFCQTGGQPCKTFRDQLGLTEEQTGRVNTINDRYTAVAEPLAARIREARSEILTELDTVSPDTSRLQALVSEISRLQAEIQHENIRQYLALKEVCDSGQAHRLSALYREMYGCPMKGEAAAHRHRHGRGAGGQP